MGLDMYLTKRIYVQNWEHNGPEGQHQVTVLLGGKPHPGVKPERVSYVIEEVAYWRKANAIHGWFVREVQNGEDECQESYVPKEKLLELVKACETVLVVKGSGQAVVKAMSEKVGLTPTEGFFFGSSGFGRDFLDDLEITVQQLKPLLEEDETGSDGYYYRASW